jgi:hypothetical protein
MEWTIPMQVFDSTKVRISTIIKSHKPMASLSYVDGPVQFPALSLLLPPLTVKSYDTETGKLALSLQGSAALSAKLTALQSLLLQTTYSNYRSWFHGEKERTYDELVSYFQPLVSHGCLHLYCPITTPGSFNEIKLYSGGEWSNGTDASNLFRAGKQVRIAVRLQGISFHQHPVSKMWTGKSRVQHRILAIYAD